MRYIILPIEVQPTVPVIIRRKKKKMIFRQIKAVIGRTLGSEMLGWWIAVPGSDFMQMLTAYVSCVCVEQRIVSDMNPKVFCRLWGSLIYIRRVLQF